MSGIQGVKSGRIRLLQAFLMSKTVCYLEIQLPSRHISVLQDNLVSSTGLIMRIGHRKEIRKLTFRALALRRSESRNCGLCVVYIQNDGATLLVGAW